MSNQVITFNFQQNNQVRTILQNGEVWFCLSDVAKVLDIDRTSELLQPERDVVKNNTPLKRGSLDPKGVCKIDTLTNSGTQQITFINEPNLYRVIFRSNKPEARQFQDWVFNEVLPTIRKTGEYKTPAPQPTPKRNYITNGDMVNIKRLIWLATHSLRYQRSAVNAVWTRLRTATGTPSPAVFEVEHLPKIAQEMTDIYQTLIKFEDMVANAEQIVIKRILQNNENADLILAECEKMINQATNDYQHQLTESHQRLFGKDIKELTNRQYLSGSDYSSCNEGNIA